MKKAIFVLFRLFLFTVVNADGEDFDLQHFVLDLRSSVPVLFALQLFLLNNAKTGSFTRIFSRFIVLDKADNDDEQESSSSSDENGDKPQVRVKQRSL